MYIGVYVYLYMYVCGYTRLCPYARVGAKHVFMFICLCFVTCYSISDSFGMIQTVAGDPDSIRIRACCGPDTQAIRRSIYGMIRKSVPVRAVKIRRRFGSETASFHVSVFFSFYNSIL